MPHQNPSRFYILAIVIFWICHFGNSKYYSPPPELGGNVYPDIFEEWPKQNAKLAHTGHLKRPAEIAHHKYLPRTTKPMAYDLKLRVIMDSEFGDELTAPGSVSIFTKCMEETDKIVMHVNTQYVKIIEESVKVVEAISGNPTNYQVPVINQTFEDDNNFYVIQLASPCRKLKKYFIDIDFITEVATDILTGLYFSTYTDPVTNITKKLATTQLEDEFARHIFPSYDNPDFKATFKVTLGRQANYTSMSNMNLIKTVPDPDLPGWYWDYYAPTPIMPTYLLAIIISDFACVSTPNYKKGVDVCGPVYMIERGGGNHSAEVVAKILEYYDIFMKQEYPLPKMTSVAIPYFRSGAMENWGLNTYRITALIYYPNKTSEAARYRIDLVIAHELAHQNFGNIVTCKFWNLIWLNEGFATYISFYGLQSVSPEFEPEKQWFASYRRRALQIDANPETRPLVNITDPFSYFDGIAYSKGASLIHMMETFLTREVFHEGLRNYLSRHAYDTATQWDLFEILNTQALVSNVHPSVATVSEIMETWTLQKGYPILRVEFATNRMIRLEQGRFFDTKPNSTTFPPNFWYVPVFINTDKTPLGTKRQVPTTWLTPTNVQTVAYLEEPFSWLVVNRDAGVFARIAYDDRLAKLIQEQLNKSPQVFSAVSRAQFIEDAFEIAWARYGSIETALNFTKYLSKEEDPLVWGSALAQLGRIYGMLVEDEEALEIFKNYISTRISSALSAAGVAYPVEEHGIAVLHRTVLLSWGGMLQLPEVLNYATSLVQEWPSTAENRVPSDLHPVTFCNTVIGGDRNTFDNMLSLLQTETDDDIKDSLATSLGCSTSEELLTELRSNLTKPEISSDLSHRIMLKLARNAVARKTMLSYFDENFDEIEEYFGGVKVVVRSIENAAIYWNTEQQLQQLLDFVEKFDTKLSEMTKSLNRAINNVKTNIEWMNQFADSIKRWFVGNV